MSDKSSPRYPYTYAADYIRMTCRRSDGELFSRSEAAMVRSVIAEVIGMPDVQLAEKLADAYLRHDGRDERYS